jgi:alpha-tubulin suppressor-like RCC1 family protein
VSTGSTNTCGVTASGTAYCWGDNATGELGIGADAAPGICGTESSPCSLQPLPVAGGFAFASLSAAWVSACGLDAGGGAYCWGDNSFGQLGIGGDTAGLATCFYKNPCSPAPRAVAGGLTFTVLGTGTSSVCGLTPAGAAYCWGDNIVGQLGIGTDSASDLCGGDPCARTPVRVAGGLAFTELSVGYLHSCGLASDGTWYCWGSNNYGQLGNGTTGPDLCQDTYLCSRVPVTVAAGMTFATVSSGGRRHSCGVTSSGSAYCWGENILGQLGDGSTSNSLTPVAVAGGRIFTSLSADQYHTCGLTTGNVAYCWGRNSWGQLGTGATGPEFCQDIFWCSTVPRRVSGQAGTALTAAVRAVAPERRGAAPPSQRPPAP